MEEGYQESSSMGSSQYPGETSLSSVQNAFISVQSNKMKLMLSVHNQYQRKIWMP